MAAPPRYSSRPLPHRAFVPGVSPRSERPAPAHRAAPIDPGRLDRLDRLAGDDAFRHGVDLFNHGFPWEAHEAWEPLWAAAPRDHPARALLHGLIQAAAAAVKARSGAHDATRSFVARACRYLARADGPRADGPLDVAALATALTAWAADPAQPPPQIAIRGAA